MSLIKCDCGAKKRIVYSHGRVGGGKSFYILPHSQLCKRTRKPVKKKGIE